MRRLLAIALFALAVPALADDLTIAKIMARDWVGTFPESPRWSDDGRAVYFEKRRPQSEVSDLYRVDVSSGKTTQIADAERGEVDPGDVSWSRDRRTKAFVRDGDLFVRDAGRGKLQQVTRTGERESAALVLTDGRIGFRRGDAFYAFDRETGTTSVLADLRLADDPDAEKPKSFLEQQQLRYFDVLREAKQRRDEAKKVAEERRGADPTQPPAPWYLGKGQSLLDADLAPDGRHLVVVLGPERDASEAGEQGADGGKHDKLARLVTESGYVEIHDVRPKVGTGKPETPKVALLDLATHERRDLDFGFLPGLTDDPLAPLRAQVPADSPQVPADSRLPSASAGGAASAPKPRVVTPGPFVWSDDGGRVAFFVYSNDNKDRWLVAVAASGEKPQTIERLQDPAWINYRFNDLGWLRDGKTVWYLSEKSGTAHLYLRPVDGAERQLTSGPFEIDTPELARDGKSFFVTSNREAPAVVEAYRVDIGSGTMTRLTAQNGTIEAYAYSPDERQLLYLASGLGTPPELYAISTRSGAGAKKLTDSTTPEFKAVQWTLPEIVAIPSSHGAGEIWANVYTPPGWSAGRSYPAVAFVHGAGYTQNVARGWTYYSREFMFHTLLTRAGYVVFDMDYRGSSGYGRAWRTAIYRQMGWPEVEDYRDGVAWLAAHKGVDPQRVGVYGGSYGGFFTFMAMFTQPDLFAAGAALRPVADWAHYNHGYTSNILNTPDVDPEAYKKSSPIEYAAGLAKPLLICHGMVDDNVVFQDTARLVQRLIELGKTPYFETAIYPVESHSFHEPSSWVDEYTRIWELFERTLGR